MPNFALEKIAFVLSLAVFAYLFGIATEAFGWFPSDFLQRAWNQAEAVSPLSTDALTGKDRIWLADRRHSGSGVTVHDSSEIQPGLTLVASRWREFEWDPGLVLMDERGEVLHRWHVNAAELFPDPPAEYSRRDPRRTEGSIHGSYLFPNGDVLVNATEYVGLARLDACGKVIWSLPAGTHHSIARDDDGTFWIPGGVYGESDGKSAYPGFNPRYRNRLLHVSEKGEILDEIIALDILFENDLERLIPKMGVPDRTKDITHLNDIEPLSVSMANSYPMFEAGDLLLSYRFQDLVMVIDRDSLQIKWYATDPFIEQHDPDFIGNGWIGIFDNNVDGTKRGRMLGGSRIVAIQPHTDSVRVLFPTSQSDAFYTVTQGSWQALENGNLLLTESQAGRLIEVTPDGRTVWEWIVPPYDEARIPEVTDGVRYDLTLEEVASWPCSDVASRDN